MHDTVTDLLDLVGLVLIAVGLGIATAGALVSPVVFAVGVGAIVAAVVLLAGSRVVDWQAHPRKAPGWWPKPRRDGES